MRFRTAVPEAVRSADGREVLGRTGSVLDRFVRCSGDTDTDAEPGKECELCVTGFGFDLVELLGDLESSSGRNAGVKTPANVSRGSGVGGVMGCFSGKDRKSATCLLGSPGVGGRLDTVLKEVAVEFGEGGDPTTRLAAGNVWPRILRRSRPVVGLLRGAVGRGGALESVGCCCPADPFA